MIRRGETETSYYPEEGIHMLNFIKNFRNDEDGAVVALGLVVGNSVKGGATALAADVGADLTAQVTE